MTYSDATLSQDPVFPAFVLSEAHGRDAKNMPFRCGLPLPQGLCFDRKALALVRSDNSEVPAAFAVSTLWPDNSIQWCLVRSRIDLLAGESVSLGIAQRIAQQNLNTAQALRVEDMGTELRLHTDARTLIISTEGPQFLSLADAGVVGSIVLRTEGSEYATEVENYDYRNVLTPAGALGMEVNLSGAFRLPEKTELRFDVCLDIVASGDRIDGSLTLHNPAAACHPRGLWDLGDPHSVFFESFELQLQQTDPPRDTNGLLRINPGQQTRKLTTSMELVQKASGGINWDSPVHTNHLGEIPLHEPGYVLQQGGEHLSGDRADPLVQVRFGATAVSARIADFWQRFPSELAVAPGSLRLGFLPQVDSAHELQPGERCTHRFTLCVSAVEENDLTEMTDSAIVGEAQVKLDPMHLQHCCLADIGSPLQIDPRLTALINAGVEGEHNFFAKREAIDEYGWRNFGDLWADHETDNYRETRLFVSHYNNQYDPLFGFLTQYMHNGSARWLELANDLAIHTRDIDIYHTENDRPEYNHGLFWHTDHYLHAETSSHRSYSKLQPKDAYEGHARGGGPGGQHCYTTGLLYHHLLTGDPASREALYGLRSWIEQVYEGSGTFTDVVLAVKNRLRPDLKNHLSGQYPLDRGVANYMNALMDCYILDRGPNTLQQLVWIIRHTVHPGDDPALRNLDNVEEHWFYVVFLQALCRFLRIKAENTDFDEDFVYARDSLLTYADWMALHEHPYLDKPEILEFPNHTWTAQDLRKANVLYQAARWAPTQSSRYLKKAEFLVDYVTETLANEPSRQYTRILALLMQNQHPSRPYSESTEVLPPRRQYQPPRRVGRFQQACNLAQLCWRALRQLEPREEITSARRILMARTGDKDSL